MWDVVLSSSSRNYDDRLLICSGWRGLENMHVTAFHRYPNSQLYLNCHKCLCYCFWDEIAASFWVNGRRNSFPHCLVLEVLLSSMSYEYGMGWKFIVCCLGYECVSSWVVMLRLMVALFSSCCMWIFLSPHFFKCYCSLCSGLAQFEEEEAESCVEDTE